MKSEPSPGEPSLRTPPDAPTHSPPMKRRSGALSTFRKSCAPRAAVAVSVISNPPYLYEWLLCAHSPPSLQAGRPIDCDGSSGTDIRRLDGRVEIHCISPLFARAVARSPATAE